jgi:hypothetical protein
VLDPIRVASEGIRDVDEPPADVPSPVLLRELGDLTLLGLPFVLGVQDEALDRSPTGLAEAPREQLGQGDLPAESADVLESAHAQSCVHDEVQLVADIGIRLEEEIIVPVRQAGSPRFGTEDRPKALRGSH